MCTCVPVCLYAHQTYAGTNRGQTRVVDGCKVPNVGAWN